jgi:hypothetical protein
MMENVNEDRTVYALSGRARHPLDDGYRKNRVVAALIAASTQFLEDPNQC